MKISLVLVTIFCLNIFSQEYSNSNKGYTLENITAITPPDGYSSPKWSPDGNKILFTKINYTGLYVIDLNAKDKIIEINKMRGAGFNAAWSEDSKNIYYRHKTPDKFKKYKSHTEVKSIDILTKQTTDHKDININGIASKVSAKSNNDIIVYLDQNTLNVKAHTLDKSKEWDITRDGRYVNPVVSPDRNKVAVNKHDEMFVFATDGSGLIYSLGRGIANSWSPDCQQILFFISEDDGHAITGADLYLINSDGSQKWQLTNTPSIFEEWPDWSPDNKQIVFSDIKTGTIYIADLIKKR
jgi:Tol biopolymer transport system component